MNVLDRGFIKVMPTSVFWTWAQKYSEDINENMTFSEPNLYLVEDEFWDDDVLLIKYMKKISFTEFGQITEHKEDWPILEGLPEFLNLFDVEIGSMVFDCLTADIKKSSI